MTIFLSNSCELKFVIPILDWKQIKFKNDTNEIRRNCLFFRGIYSHMPAQLPESNVDIKPVLSYVSYHDMAFQQW